MRFLLGLFLLTGLTRVAAAHTLAADDGLPAQLSHQLLGWHHFPLTILLLVAGIWLFRRWSTARKS